MRRFPTGRKIVGIPLCALLLAVLLCGCGGLQGESTGPSEEELAYLDSFEVQRKPVKLSEIAYVEMDLEELRSQINAHVTGIREAQDFTGVVDHMMAARALLDEYDTMYVFTQLRYNADQASDEKYRQYMYYSDHYEEYDRLWNGVYTALQRGPYADSLLPVWDTSYDAPYFYSSDSNQSGKLQAQVTEIQAEAQDILSNATVSYEGEDITLDDAYYYYEWESALSLWLEEYGPRLLELYTQLAATRSQIARDYYDFDGYAEYAFALYQRDYTPKQAKTLVEDILKHLLPLDEDLSEAGYWDWENIYDYYADFETCMEKAKPVMEIMGADFAEAQTLLRNYELYEIGTEGEQYFRPYVSYLWSFHIPVMYCPFYDDVASFGDFLHEFGHFYEFYVAKDAFSMNDDLSEIHSQTFFLLFAENYEKQYDEDTMLAYALADIVDTLVYQSVNAYIELSVYNLPEEEMTEDRIREIGRIALARFGYTISTDALANYRWLTDEELFTDPLQPFSYVTSAVASMEIWRMAQGDMTKALETYHKLIQDRQGDFFVENIEAAGIEGLFGEGWALGVAEELREFLIEAREQADAA